MLIAQRQSLLKDLLAQRGMADLDSLAAELQVSQSTVRRDIEQLEANGIVRRTHGGVIWLGDQTVPASRPPAFDQRMPQRIAEKRRIAKAAAALVQPGQTILIDGGTTTYYLAEHLVGQSMQLVTNSLPIANLFLNDENVELLLTGGLMYPRYGVLLGPMVEQSIAGLHAQILFFSVAGVYQDALYNQNLLLVQSEQRMMSQAQRVALLVDSSKFGQQALARLCDLKRVHTVVTDSGIAPEHRRAVEDAGCELIIASDE